MPWDLAHFALRAVYAVLPIFYAAILLNRGYRLRQPRAIRELVSTAASALAIGAVMATVFALAVGARVRVDQVLLAGLYFFAELIVLKGLDAVARYAGTRLFGVARAAGPPTDPATAPRIAALVDAPPPGPRWRRLAAAMIRLAVLVTLGLPYVMAAAMAYRPKVAVTSDPYDALSWRFESVTFPATDGLKISAWYIPAPPMPAGVSPDLAAQWGRRTALVCHGLGANKLNQLHMGRAFYARGWNLLALDFRAHGDSAGQFSTFGDHERRDVLGAVRFIKAHHPGQARQIVGVGASLGAAALIAAATDPAYPESAQIDGLVIYATYADLGQLTAEITAGRMPPVAGWLARTLALPLASLHAGTNLAAFAPGRLIVNLGPRPVFFIHGRRDEIIPPHHAQQLYNAAPGPKKLTLLDADHNTLIDDDPTNRAAAQYFDAAPAGR